MMNEFCMMEDDIPRDGGILPEYAATLFICVDKWNADTASGKVWSFCYQKPVPFRGLGNLLLTLDQMLDAMGTPNRWFEPRTVAQARNCLPEAAPCGMVYHKPTAFRKARGRIGTAAIRVYARQNASMQGTLRLCGEKQESVQFRSALELLHLLQEWLIANDKTSEAVKMTSRASSNRHGRSAAL